MAQWIRIRLPLWGRGFSPRSGRIAQATERLSLCATAPEAAPHNWRSPGSWRPCSAPREGPTEKKGPCSPELEKAPQSKT